MYALDGDIQFGKRLRVADKQITSRLEIAANLVYDCLLNRSVEIDQNITQEDDIKAFFNAIVRHHEVQSMKADFLA